MVQVQGDGDVHVGGQGAEHPQEPVAPVGADRLDRRLQDDRGAFLHCCGENGFDAQVVDDVERRDAVPLRERPVENVLGGHDWHGASRRRGR